MFYLQMKVHFAYTMIIDGYGKGKDKWNVEAIQYRSSKYSKNVMMFEGICYKRKTHLICIDGNIDSITYCDECIDGTGISKLSTQKMYR